MPRRLQPHAVLGNPFVDQLRPSAGDGEFALVHPSGDRLVVLLRHQQRQREPAQHPFGGPSPFAMLVVHVEEFTGVGQLFRRQPERRAQLRTHRDLLMRQVVGALLQARDLLDDGVALTPALPLPADRVDGDGVEVLLLGGQSGPFGGGQPRQRDERFPVRHRFQPGIADGLVEQRPGLTTRVGLRSGLGGEPLQLADPIPARFRALLDQGFALVAELSLLGFGGIALLPQGRAVRLEPGDLGAQELGA